jgi:[ribosomal protein S5]-alanine N-acetyltransferase
MITLETERLCFRDHEPGDLEPFCAMEMDPRTRLFFRGPRTRQQAEERFRDVFLSPRPDRMRLWATVYKPDAAYAGYCGIYHEFQDQQPVPGVGVLAFYLAPEYWGRGLATEAGRAFVQFGWSDLGLDRIIAGVSIRNVASVRVLEKVGLKRVRTVHQPADSYYDYVLNRPGA